MAGRARAARARVRRRAGRRPALAARVLRAVFTLLQRLVPNQMLTRVLGLVWGLAMGGVALGSIAAPAVVRALGPRPAFVVVGSILPLLALLAYRRLIEIDRTVGPAPELEL